MRPKSVRSYTCMPSSELTSLPLMVGGPATAPLSVTAAWLLAALVAALVAGVVLGRIDWQGRIGIKPGRRI